MCWYNGTSLGADLIHCPFRIIAVNSPLGHMMHLASWCWAQDDCLLIWLVAALYSILEFQHKVVLVTHKKNISNSAVLKEYF